VNGLTAECTIGLLQCRLYNVVSYYRIRTYVRQALTI